MVSKQEQSRERVYRFYLANRSKGKKFTLDHFLLEKIPKRTIYRIIERAERDSGHERVRGSGRKAQIMTRKGIRRLQGLFNNKSGISQRQAARKFGCSQSYVSQTLSKKTSIRARKKMTIPKRNEQQQEVARSKCRALYLKYGKSEWITDDESYFTLSHSSINGNNLFYTSNVETTPTSIKYTSAAKFEDKMLVYLCMSEKGLSKPYFMPSGLAINQKIYLEECIKKRLMPFISEYHSDGNYVFWPDLASSHYAKTVTDYLTEQKVTFVSKQENPANLPECRPIEDFWSILKGMVYNNNWQAQDLVQLRRRIEYCLAKVDIDLVQRLCRSTTKRLDFVRRHGIIEKR